MIWIEKGTRDFEKWHKWFAWCPVVIGHRSIDGSKIVAWFQYVGRRLILSTEAGNLWEYKSLDDKNT